MPTIRRRVPLAVAASLLAATSGCAKKSSSSSNNATPTETPTPNASGAATTDPSLQTTLIASQLDLVINALSDGGTGASGAGGGDAGLVDELDLGDPNVTQTCAVTAAPQDLALTSPDAKLSWTVKAQTPLAVVTRVHIGSPGNLVYSDNADGTPSTDTETWYPGPYFGLANIAPDATPAGATWGTLTADGVPKPTPAAGAAPATSGVLGSVGFRSLDGSWTGAPAWEVGSRYLGFINGSYLDPTATEGLVMYLAAKPPQVTAATTAPVVGGAYQLTQMLGPDYTGIGTPPKADLLYVVLGQADKNGVIPSFTADGRTMVLGASKPVDQAGTIAAAGVPGRLYNPPTALVCAANTFPTPGWRFSQNVAGLTRVDKSALSYTHAYAKGIASIVHTGQRTTTFADPATVAPFTASPTAPYFDKNLGTFSATHTMGIGTAAAPASTLVTYTPDGGAAKPAQSAAVYTSAPFVVTTARNLNDPAWAWTQRTVASGALSAAVSANGGAPTLNIVTTYQNIVFNNTAVLTTACTPTAGTVTAVLTPTDAGLAVTTYTLRFGSSITAGVNSTNGVTVQVTCSGGSSPTDCAAAAEADDLDFKPSYCSF